MTKDADKLLLLIYKEYLDKRKKGQSKQKAKMFGSSHDIHKNICQEWLFDDVDDTCKELDDEGMLNCLIADAIAYHVELTNEAISKMENRFKNGLTEILDYISKIF